MQDHLHKGRAKMINDTNWAISYFYLTIGGTLYYCVTLLVSELSQNKLSIAGIHGGAPFA